MSYYIRLMYQLIAMTFYVWKGWSVDFRSSKISEYFLINMQEKPTYRAVTQFLSIMISVVLHLKLHCWFLFSLAAVTERFFCFRLEAPRYRRVSPASAPPQRLVITKEVSGYFMMEIELFERKSKTNLIKMSVFFLCADNSSATLRCGSSVERHHLHTGAIRQLH